MTRASGSAGTKSYQEKFVDFVAARDAGEIAFSETAGFTTSSANAQAIRKDLNNWVANGIPGRLTAECPEFADALIRFCPSLAVSNIALADKDARFAGILRAYLRKELTGKERKKATERLSLINRDMVGAMGEREFEVFREHEDLQARLPPRFEQPSAVPRISTAAGSGGCAVGGIRWDRAGRGGGDLPDGCPEGVCGGVVDR
ncbi:hypothetical protein [Micromonospora sp. SH-82]|uniref:hypothetical protein n=1 Tax=Micromonospora sp. SH-82 TaxID=3132938 RepID=UPI003EBAFF87